MSHTDDSNGRHTGPHDRRLVNPYADAATKAQPEEILDYEIETDPYRNLLPGMSNVYAARTLGRGLREGRRGNRVVLAVSLLLVVVLVLPAFLAALAQIVR
ncbi:MAG TPA: hypothetical protein VF221_16055 [Chloroflexota bacterium]